MLDYEIFKEVVKGQLKDYLPAKYCGMEMETATVDKVNAARECIRFFDPDGKTRVTPSIYLDDLYRMYENTKDLEGVLKNAGANLADAFEYAHEINPVLNLESAKENIVFQLINTEQNRTMLSGMPHREFQDLSIVYRWVVKMDGDGIQSAMIRNGLAEQMGLSEEQLYRLAAENTRRLMPPVVKSMNEVMREIFAKDGMPEELMEMMLGEMPKEQMMWVVTNDKGINGAISMLYEDSLHSLAEDIGSDLYILPSSVHETIAISAEMGEPEQLAAMVSEINLSQVALDERLSNQVYHYDKDLRRLTLATDTPNKRLDGMLSGTQGREDGKTVAEPPMIYGRDDRSR